MGNVLLLRFVVVAAYCACAFFVEAQAQAHAPFMRIGGAVYGGQNIHQANFHDLEGVPISPKAENFTEGSGIAYGISGVWELPVLANFFIGTRLGFHSLGGVLRTQEGPITSDNGNVILEHAIDASVFSVAAEPGVGVEFGNQLSLYSAVRLGWVVSSTFEQSESIVQPLGIEYVNGGGRSRSIATRQAIPNTPGLELAFVGRLGYLFSLSQSVALRPEVSFQLGATEISAGTGWNIQSVQGGVALLWQPTYVKAIRTDTVYKRDTTIQVIAGLLNEEVVEKGSSITIEQEEHPQEVRRTAIVQQYYVRKIPRPRPLLTADLGVRFVLNNGQESEGVKVTIKKIVEQRYIPLLPYIFFDSVSAVLPKRYNQIGLGDAKYAMPDSVPEKEVLPTYYNLLNIVGMRMQQRPNATLFITGTYAGEKAEKGDTLLSRRRAESIRDYLSKVWDIDLHRLQVRAGGLPERPSNALLAGGNEENRRAELAADDSAILAPLHILDTVRVANPPVIRFYPQCISESGLASWRIHVLQGKRVLKSFRGEGTLPAFVDWNIDNDKAILVSADAPIEYKLTVSDNEEQEIETPQGSIVFQVQEHNASEADKSGLQRYSLIVFDYDGVSVTPHHLSILSTVQNNLPAQADVTVVGMTDVLGNNEYNKQLSLRRAQAIASALKYPHATVIGIGEQTNIPATTPEGRFYSRRVDIVIRARSTQ